MKSVLRWFGHIEEMENNRDVKRVYEEECTGTGGVG